MNIKKYLREQAEKDDEALITEEDRLFCQQLAQKYVAEKDKNKKKKFKILKYILVGISIYVAVLVIEFCCIYAVQGNNTWNYIKEFLEWYITLFI